MFLKELKLCFSDFLCPKSFCDLSGSFFNFLSVSGTGRKGPTSSSLLILFIYLEFPWNLSDIIILSHNFSTESIFSNFSKVVYVCSTQNSFHWFCFLLIILFYFIFHFIYLSPLSIICVVCFIVTLNIPFSVKTFYMLEQSSKFKFCSSWALFVEL